MADMSDTTRYRDWPSPDSSMPIPLQDCPYSLSQAEAWLRAHYGSTRRPFFLIAAGNTKASFMWCPYCGQLTSQWEDIHTCHCGHCNRWLEP
jgi:hypothetical protein